MVLLIVLKRRDGAANLIKSFFQFLHCCTNERKLELKSKMSKKGVLTNALAIDCEMVEAFSEWRNSYVNMVARVSLVNEYGKCVYDTYVKPTKPVTDYRTRFSGVTERHLASGQYIQIVKSDVADKIRGGILVGHGVDKDLRVLGLGHPEWKIRDTSEYPPFQTRRGKPSLKNLAQIYLGWTIQNGPHSSVEDARAAMMVYKTVEDEWEGWLEESSSEEESDEYYYDSSDY